MKPIVIGNWKMNPQSPTLALRLATDIKKGISKIREVDVVIAPPNLYIETVKKSRNTSQLFSIGAQNTHSEKLGAHTGETSSLMLKGSGVEYVIIGHSERRAAGETNADIALKMVAALREGVIPVVCVGELTRDTEGQYLSFIEDQVRTAFENIKKSDLAKTLIAYEPIWAIGTGNNATPEDAHEVKLFIQKVLSDMFGRASANHVRILYGGSVNAKNAQELMEHGAVDGFLVGGSSLNADEFAKIVKTAELYAKH